MSEFTQEEGKALVLPDNHIPTMSGHIKEEHLTSSEFAPGCDHSKSMLAMEGLQSISHEKSKESNATENENLEFVLVKEECNENDEEISIKPEPMLMCVVQQEDHAINRKRKRSQDSPHPALSAASSPNSAATSEGFPSDVEVPELNQFKARNWKNPSHGLTSCMEAGEAREMLMDVDPLTAAFMARESDEDTPSSTSPTSSQAPPLPGASTSSDRHSRATPTDRHSWMTPSDHHSRMIPSDGSRMTPSDRHSRMTPTDRHSRRTPTPTRSKGKRKKVADALDEALILVVNEMRSLRQEQRTDPVDAFCRFMASSLRKVSAEQRDICQALCYNALRRGKRGGLSDEHKIVKVEALGQFRMM